MDDMTLAEAADFLGKDGRKPHVGTLWRWCSKGVRGVRLQYRRYGRTVRVTRAALTAFGEALAAADMAEPAPSPAIQKRQETGRAARARRTDANRKDDIAAAEKAWSKPAR